MFCNRLHNLHPYYASNEGVSIDVNAHAGAAAAGARSFARSRAQRLTSFAGMKMSTSKAEATIDPTIK
jgi:hypothetical protein